MGNRNNIFLFVMVLASPLYAATPATAPGEKVWHLFGYLNGTSTQIAQAINGPLGELLDKNSRLETRIKELQSERDATEATVLDELRHRKDYRALANDATTAKQQLDAARAAGDTATALDSGGRYNRDRIHMSEMEKLAVASSRELKNAIGILEDKKAELSQVGPAILKARKWRDNMLEAMRGSFRLPGPVAIGSEGILDDATVEQVLGRQDVLVLFEAKTPVTGEETKSDAGDGIVTVQVYVNDAYLLIHGIPTDGMAKGQHVHWDCSFSVIDMKNDPALEQIYVVRKKTGPVTKLFEAIDSFKDTPSTQPDASAPANDP
jgi:hypothetical protein